ncbi:MAG: phytanoyl-CoA dioxygenase family protein [Lentisphaeria bacterium]|nr:phytanoyl-CoA dioxygenase family protein [Lentisphaeria bacterium]NQZ70123.1 phytanoyl-CoA dioxygenase family protein [Lentisphaeria bacterium]
MELYTIEAGKKVRMGGHELEFGKDIGELRSSNELLDDKAAMMQRLKDDGYLFIRDFHDKELVKKARMELFEDLSGKGCLKEGTDIADGKCSENSRWGMFGQDEIKEFKSYLDVVNSPKLLSTFGEMFGGEATTYDFKWLRSVSTGSHTGFHYDVVYMGRGTLDVYTCWIPLTDVELERGSLMLALGSQKSEKLKETYGKMDVDRDNVQGWFSDDPFEVMDVTGAEMATAEFGAGDILIFGMFMMHGSLTNVSDDYRLSSDTRYQLTTDAIDERWVGEKPMGHGGAEVEAVSMKDAREEWEV